MQARVFVAAPGRQLFQRIRDDRLTLYPPGWTGDLEPDLVVFPSGQIRQFAALSGDLPPQVRTRVASGEARVVLDASDEGLEHSPDLHATLHGFLQRLGAPPGRAVYITQHRGFSEDYQAFGAASGAGAPMTILNYDYWIKRLVSPYEIKGRGFYLRRRAQFLARERTRPRRFLSLNWSPRPAKLVFLLKLMKDRLWDDGYISFGGIEQLKQTKLGDSARLMKAMRGLDGFGPLIAELSPHVERLVALGAIEFNVATPETPLKIAERLQNDLPLVEYHQSWFSAVTESEMASRPVRVTEKAFKPLLNFHPFVILGNPGSLALLRGMGFETFPELFDETYDEVAEPRIRFDMAYAQVARLCRMDEADLARLEAGIADKLDHNARVALTELPQRYREEFDRDLIDALVPGLPPAAARAAPAG